jgi:hypothetical protein
LLNVMRLALLKARANLVFVDIDSVSTKIAKLIGFSLWQ